MKDALIPSTSVDAVVAWAENAPFAEAKALGEVLRAAIEDGCSVDVLVSVLGEFQDWAEELRKRFIAIQRRETLPVDVVDENGHCSSCRGTGYRVLDAPVPHIVRCETCEVFARDREAFQCWVENEFLPLYAQHATVKMEIRKSTSKGELKKELDLVYEQLENKHNLYRSSLRWLRVRGE